MKVLTVLGTRPEIIRLSRIMVTLDDHIEQTIVNTGQNDAYELNDLLFEDLELRTPDHNLNIDTSSVGRAYGEVLIRIESILTAEQPDVVLLLGDTNSSIAAVLARRMGITVFHLEAGNRCFDWEVPEETNRRVVDHVSHLNLVYTEHARRNLLAEGIHPQRIFLIGSPMREVIDHYRAKIEASTILRDHALEPGRYLLASLHREENVDNPDRLASLMEGLRRIAEVLRLPILMSTHPRTRRRLEETGLAVGDSGIRFHPPFGFCDYAKLQLAARCVVSDSGTISEEAAILGLCAVTPRPSTERPEALDAGSVVVAGRDPEAMVRAVTTAIAIGPSASVPDEYSITDTSGRVLRLVVGSVRADR
jgi:UDP-N-acetylglucosamine 2-epimerase (non-hydrolysing)